MSEALKQAIVSATGVFSAGLTLPPSTPPGSYTAAASIDGAQ
jgi:hypothetical protein